MTNLKKPVMLVIVVMLLWGITGVVALAQSPDQGKVAYEEQVWQCQRCHGPNGEGLWGRPLAGTQSTADEWIAQVRTPRRSMPAFTVDQITDQQIIDMQVYFSSLTAPADFAPKMPVESADPGQNLLLQKRCVSCHASESETGTGRMIDNFIERGVTPTQELVINQLRTPFQNMPAYRADQVSDEDAALMAEFLATQVAAQTPPPALPQSGASTLPWALILLVTGSGLLLTGLLVRFAYVRHTS